uniref:Galectin n=1 Tax=Mastacembelus armatus TaxID=205130 RepID=A0A3Q3LN17_9TELE
FQELELKNVDLRAGDQSTWAGMRTTWLCTLTPRFHDDADGAVLVCNSKTDGCWGDEKCQLMFKLTGDMFEVELPGGQEVHFPNRVGMDAISYVRVRGDFRLTAFKIC